MKRLPFIVCVAVVGTALAAEEPFDHAATIKGLRHGDVKAGRALYALHCASCHGKDGDLALNPLARKFAKDEFKFGSDPYSLWKTTSYGNGLMFRWDAVLSPKERYQIVHHIREEIIKPKNPSQYSEPPDEYFAKLNALAAADAEEQAKNAQKITAAPGMIDGSAGKNMNYGPVLQHAVAFGPIKNKNAEHIENTTERALVVDLPDDHVICYDVARLSVSGLWKGKIADTTKTHHTSYKGGLPLRPGGEVSFSRVDEIGWEGGDLKFHGHYLHGGQIVLSYSVGGRKILETPVVAEDSVVRCLRIAPGDKELKCLAVGGEWTRIRSSSKTISITLGNENPAAPPFAKLTTGGPRHWPTTVQTAVALGESVEGYAADALTVPLANPYGSWMRTTALDFFADGSMAVSTLSGDVWIVSWTKGNPNALTWSRFASGLYEPLGLKIVDEKIYVRGRDRITRLHDLNKDGEADYYESFHEDTNEIGASYHAFVYDLQTDEHGNFYYSQSGYKSPLTGGVVRVSPDGRYSEFVGTDLRNPNGMGAGGPEGWITVADNPSGKAVFNGFMIAKKGAVYGYEKNRNVPMLVVLPAKLDSSSGSQCWSDPKRWGPLSGSIFHTSYSRCAVFYCFTQNLDPHPNGFAVRFPFDLKSGAMRARVHPIDRQMYVACQKGWDTSARHDGVIYRFRHTGEPSHMLSGASATTTGLRLTFSCKLDASSINTGAFKATRGTDKKGDTGTPVALGEVRLLSENSVEVKIPKIEDEVVELRTSVDKKTGAKSVSVRMPIGVTFDIKAVDGTPIRQTVYATINSLPPGPPR